MARVGINGERQNSYKIVAIHAKDLSVSIVGSMAKIELISGATTAQDYHDYNG
jgi:hypothetical protein